MQPTSTGHSTGHTVLVVPVPELDAYVRARTAHHDASFLSRDPAFVHAHVTLLGPWVTRPEPKHLDRVAGVLARHRPFVATLRQVSEFPDGLLHLRPEPDGPFRSLTAALVEEFPDHPPYAGRYPDPVPHLTLDQRTEHVTPLSVRRDLAGVLPVRFRVDRVDLQWWANDDCRLLASWKLEESR